MIDIVIPQNNEEEFVQMAEQLGITGLIFAYKNRKSFYTKKSKIPITNALLTEPQKLSSAKDVPTICHASREAIERGANIVYNFETLEQKEHTHYRRSGLNQVLCKLATNKKVHIGFNFTNILNNAGQKRATIIGRMTQNIAFCTKYKTPMKIASFATNPYELRSPADLKALFQQLGMHASQAQQALK